ncbi:MAG TPA: RHS repeat-associated core domain-containing protein [Alphaproteobacteria bacterium]|nr:RHS repeat-associated core domain-containing protein [Alphaproteobacteria bacterium]
MNINNKAKITLIAIAAIFLAIISSEFISAVDINFTYDSNGNMISGDGRFRTYNSVNQLSRIYNGSNASMPLLFEYRYHPVEDRVWMKRRYLANGSIAETTYYFTKNSLRVINSSGTFNITYIYHDGVLIAQSINNIKTYFLTDALGNVVASINATTGSAFENTTYSPYGDIITGGNRTRYDFRGREYDDYSLVSDFNLRKYNPDMGVFIQPKFASEIYDPQLFNPYAFSRNNPYRVEMKD